MRRAVIATLAVAAALGGVAPSTQAGGFSTSSGGFGLLFSNGGAGLERTTTFPLRVSGTLAIDFHGDHAQGCAVLGTCETSGSLTWTPPSEGELDLNEYRRRGRRSVDGALFLASGYSSDAAPVMQTRRRTPDGSVASCSDEVPDFFPLTDVPGHGTTLTVGAASPGSYPNFLRTRCPGPLAEDVARAFATRDVTVAQIRARQPIDLSGRHPFAAGGFDGDVISTLVLRPGRPAKPVRQPRVRLRTRVRRFVQVRLRVERFDGAIRTDFAGMGEPALCGPLDACGASGTAVATPAGVSGTGFLRAEANASRSRSDVRAAVGLARGGRGPAVRASGVAFWRSATGATAATVERADGSPACHGGAPLRAGDVSLKTRQDRLVVAYAASGSGPSGDPLRSRCGGPTLAEISGGGALATGSVPLTALRARRIVVHLARGARLGGQGYLGQSVPDLTLVLRRTRVRDGTYKLREPYL